MINKKPILVVFAISIALIFLMAPVAAASHSINPAVTSTSTGNYQPDPTLNTNATWATFHHGWNATEYNNGSANVSLNAGLSTFYANPISINPIDIQGSLNNYTHKIASATTNMEWDGIDGATGEPESAGTNGPSGGAVYGIANTSGQISFTLNTSAAAANGLGAGICVDTSNLPSSNLQYDYFTGAAEITTGTQITGLNMTIGFNSNHANRIEAVAGYTNKVDTPVYISVPLSQYAADIGYNISGTMYPRFDISLNVPVSTTATTYTVKIFDFGITTYANSLGSQIINGTSHTVEKVVGNAQLSTFNPSFTWSSVINGGYSVALSASPNITEVQTPITSGNYIEQVQYSGTFELASAPDLSYGASNITFPLTVPADQVQVLTLGGSSYINSLGNKTNGTVQLVSGISPTSPTSYYAIVDYTASQWQSISHPAGFFTYDGIAYYYWLAIGAIASLLALGVGVRHAKTKREQTEKVDRITRRGR